MGLPPKIIFLFAFYVFYYKKKVIVKSQKKLNSKVSKNTQYLPCSPFTKFNLTITSFSIATLSFPAWDSSS